jgi:hypothetical protein
MTEPSYPELPEGCQIEEGRRQLAIGEMRIPGSDRLLAFSTMYGWIWVPEPALHGSISVNADVVSRAIEEKP